MLFDKKELEKISKESSEKTNKDLGVEEFKEEFQKLNEEVKNG